MVAIESDGVGTAPGRSPADVDIVLSVPVDIDYPGCRGVYDPGFDSPLSLVLSMRRWNVSPSSKIIAWVMFSNRSWSRDGRLCRRRVGVNEASAPDADGAIGRQHRRVAQAFVLIRRAGGISGQAQGEKPIDKKMREQKIFAPAFFYATLRSKITTSRWPAGWARSTRQRC
uniref:Uncharacterized protein n=1 Tax=Candidatus Kentrum eta TaxID=2126337 RepID=A0A450UZL2_9GAMM|nr:MAG: hypothetical protein BECKH772A_GA0070896_101153 [Candidatus Kentron sp. H]VFJ97885.1 MAG: hypothetical protein BECKH772B_GA0070898_101213 [Candidatus Kentron sp. H]VFK03150.1 MAG: hypothetical protein BECKH772C_GA0070978_101153 [Candidatus Kentron sp. H]